MLKTHTHTISGQMGRIILQGMEEIMGRQGVDSVLQEARLAPVDAANRISRQYICGIQKTLEQKYGKRSGWGLALQSGRASVKYGLREWGPELGLMEMKFRLLPMRSRLREGLRLLAKAYSEEAGEQVEIEEDEHTFRWIVSDCSVCCGRKASEPVCHMTVGVLQEFLYWASGGKTFPVVEKECAATGAPACVFVVNKQPME